MLQLLYGHYLNEAMLNLIKQNFLVKMQFTCWLKTLMKLYKPRAYNRNFMVSHVGYYFAVVSKRNRFLSKTVKLMFKAVGLCCTYDQYDFIFIHSKELRTLFWRKLWLKNKKKQRHFRWGVWHKLGALWMCTWTCHHWLILCSLIIYPGNCATEGSVH